jgi:hypothetical protein
MSLQKAQPVPRSHRLLVHGHAESEGPLRLVLFYLLLGVFGSSLNAESLQTWNELEHTALRTSRLELSVEGTHRFGETVGDLYDRRLGTNLEYRLLDRLQLWAGHVLRNRDIQDGSINENRFIAGVGYPIWTGAVEIEGSTLYERISVPTPDFNRYKQQFEISQPGKKLSPWVYQQFLFRQGNGFVRSRSRFGMKWRGSRYTFKAAYQFETISTGTAWAPRHAIFTEIGIDRPLWFRE